MKIGCGFDPAFRSDACAGCIVIEHRGIYYVAATFERRPAKGAPLVPSVVTREFCDLVKRYNGKHIVTDSFYLESVREHVAAAGLATVEAPGGAQGKARVYGVAQELLHGGKVRVPASQRRLIQQLAETISKPLPGGGISITSPRKRGGHGDLASAFVLAVWRAERLARNGSSSRGLISAGSARGDSDHGVRIWGTRHRGKDYSLPEAERLRRFLDGD